MDLVKQFFPDVSWIADKKVQHGCSKRRPNLLLDLGTHVIIIEVDENKHNSMGVMRVSRKKEKEWNFRIETLLNQIRYWIKNDPIRIVTIVELFY